MSADLYPPNDIDSDWTFGHLEEYANQLYARALAAETECASLIQGQVRLADRIVAIEAERDQALKAKSGTAGDPEMYLLAVEEGQKALDRAHAAEAERDSLRNQRDQAIVERDGARLGREEFQRLNSELQGRLDRGDLTRLNRALRAEARVKALEQALRQIVGYVPNLGYEQPPVRLERRMADIARAALASLDGGEQA